MSGIPQCAEIAIAECGVCFTGDGAVAAAGDTLTTQLSTTPPLQSFLQGQSAKLLIPPATVVGSGGASGVNVPTSQPIGLAHHTPGLTGRHVLTVSSLTRNR